MDGLQRERLKRQVEGIILCVCLERQPSRSINIVGKDDISRQGEIPDRQRGSVAYSEYQVGAAEPCHAASVFIPQSYCQLHYPAHPPADSSGHNSSKAVGVKALAPQQLYPPFSLHPCIQSGMGLIAVADQVCPFTLHPWLSVWCEPIGGQEY